MSTSPGIFVAKNGNQQVIISSDTSNLHFIGKASLNSLVEASGNNGGFRRWSYRIVCSKPPMPFLSMPVTGTGNMYGVSAIRIISTNYWEIEVITSGTYGNDSGYAPEVYIFADPSATTTATEPNGLLVFKDNGSISFDSRKEPLNITNGTSAQPPYNPINSPPTGLSARNCSSGKDGFRATNYSYITSLSNQGTKPIFFYPSNCQSEREATFYDQTSNCLWDQSDGYGGCLYYREIRKWNSTYWAYYRSGIAISSTNLYCGWIVVRADCAEQFIAYDEGWLGFNWNSVNRVGGIPPATNTNFNVRNDTILVADGSMYD